MTMKLATALSRRTELQTHIHELEERIDRQIIVRKTPKGSMLVLQGI